MIRFKGCKFLYLDYQFSFSLPANPFFKHSSILSITTLEYAWDKSEVNPESWTHGKNGSPKTLDESDLPFIQSALAEKEYILFGRKFEADSSVLDKLDIMIQ